MQNMRLHHSIKHNEEARKNATAIVTAEEAYTYAQLWERVNECANSLKGIGLGKKDVLGLVYTNQLDGVVFIYAVDLLGLPCVLLGGNSTAYEIEKLIEGSKVTAIAAPLAQSKVISKIPLFALADKTVWRNNIVIRVGVENCNEEMGYLPGDGIAQVTSGSNGLPKVSVRTVDAVLSEITQTASHISLDERDTVLTIPPIHHSYGLFVGLLAPLYVGAKVILVDQFFGADVLDLITAHSPSVLVAVPYMYSILIKTAKARLAKAAWPPQNWKKMRLCLSAGTALDEQIASDFLKYFSVEITQDYGSTETGVICIAKPVSTGRKNVGFPVGSMYVCAMDKDGVSELAPGLTGRIAISSERIARAYISPAELNKEAFREGWFYTDDLGSIGDDGSVTLCGRVSEVMNIAGNKVDSSEVEAVINTFPNINENAVICQQGRETENIIVAFIVSEFKVDINELLRHIKKHLAGHKLPKRIVQIEQLPRTRTGKVLKKELHVMLDSGAVPG